VEKQVKSPSLGLQELKCRWVPAGVIKRNPHPTKDALAPAGAPRRRTSLQHPHAHPWHWRNALLAASARGVASGNMGTHPRRASRGGNFLSAVIQVARSAFNGPSAGRKQGWGKEGWGQVTSNQLNTCTHVQTHVCHPTHARASTHPHASMHPHTHAHPPAHRRPPRSPYTGTLLLLSLFLATPKAGDPDCPPSSLLQHFAGCTRHKLNAFFAAFRVRFFSCPMQAQDPDWPLQQPCTDLEEQPERPPKPPHCLGVTPVG